MGRNKIQEDTWKIGVVFIAGGLAAWVLDHSVDMVAAIGVVIAGVFFVLVGSVTDDREKSEE